MKILLPPSEGKTPPAAGAPLQLEGIAFSELTHARMQVISALQELGAGPQAAKVLKLGPRSAEQARANLNLLSGPAVAAEQLYTGVLFEALAPAEMNPQVKKRFAKTTLIASALFGFIKPNDLIPDHRLAIGVSLPPLGPLARWWKPQLGKVLEETGKQSLVGKAIFDCRPEAYRAAFRAEKSHVITMNVEKQVKGDRKVVTHWSKHWRGLAAAHLVQDGDITEESDAGQIVDSLAGLPDLYPGMRFEVGDHVPTAPGGSTLTVTLVLPEGTSR